MTPMYLMESIIQGSMPEQIDSVSSLEVDVFAELQLLDVRLDGRRGFVGALFEGRLGLGMGDGDAGIIVARGLTAFEWETEHRNTTSTAWNIISASINDAGIGVKLEMDFFPDGVLRINSQGLVFFEVATSNLAGMGIPNYSSSEAEIRAATIGWESAVSVVRCMST